MLQWRSLRHSGRACRLRGNYDGWPGGEAMPEQDELTLRQEIAQRVISQARAMSQIQEAATVLLDNAGSPQERWLLRFVRYLYRHRLDGLLADVPDWMAAEIREGWEGGK